MSRMKRKLHHCIQYFFVYVILYVLFAFIVAGHVTNRTLECSNGMSMPVTSLCDGSIDCNDDEIYFGRGFKCKVNGNQRRCVIPQSILHDDVADCDDQSDLCFHKNGDVDFRRCFQCVRSLEYISRTQVCDGIIDCLDLSDECLCLSNHENRPQTRNPICEQLTIRHPSDIPVFSTNLSANSTTGCRTGQVTCRANTSEPTVCIKGELVCDGRKNCPLGDDEEYCEKEFICIGSNATATSCDGEATCEDFSDECDAGCWDPPEYCGVIKNGRFQCTEDTNSRFQNSSIGHVLHPSLVCNNVIDCPLSNADETNCSTSSHYYCWNSDVTFVNISYLFDQRSNCEDKSDECPEYFHKGKTLTYTYRNDLIRNPILQIIVWLVAVISLGGNSIVIIGTSRELWRDRQVEKLGRLAKCNRTLVLNLAVADFMMGLYLLMLGIATAVKSDRYCSSDRTWRTSQLCSIMGIMAQFSSQTSVLLLVLMTSYRLYGTLRPFQVEESKLLGGAAFLTGCSWMLSFMLSFLPQFRSLMDYFISEYWLPMPFLTFDFVNKTTLRELVLRLDTIKNGENSTLDNEDLQWRSMISYVKKSNIRAIHPDWNKTYNVPIGYYNKYPLCQPFFYPNLGETGWEYMTSIIVLNFVAFVYIAVAYVVIYRASSRPNVRKSVRRRSRQWRRDNRKMQKKVMLLVATDMACWLPICIIFLLRMSGVQVHDVVHGITGTVLLPINSAMNPIIYSTTVNKIRDICRKKKRGGYYDTSSDASDAARYSVDPVYVRQSTVSTEATLSIGKPTNGSLGNINNTGKSSKPGVRFNFGAVNGSKKKPVNFQASEEPSEAPCSLAERQESLNTALVNEDTTNDILPSLNNNQHEDFMLITRGMKESVL